MAHRLKLVSFDICPYVERSRIVLLEKGLPHEIEFIELSNKPAWFLEISPMGRVPVLLVDDRPVFESMVINELVNELEPEPAMFPRDPVARAEARGWIVYSNDVVMPAGSAAMLAIAGGASDDEVAKRLGALRDALGKLEAQLARAGGPFFLGRDFSLVDASYAPFFRRWRMAERWGSSDARLLASSPKVSAWVEAMLARPSVIAAEAADLDGKSRRFYERRAAQQQSAAPA
ncbi:MAG TPA: glutathione S-transferase family protein [Anaeromyxobacteraceae bacterium]|nr:glutathione S-transferase family protein [Anaeromyxobacteraceae bacterium]